MLTYIVYTNVLLTPQVCIAQKTFEGQTETIPCGLIPENQYWANTFTLLRLISRPFRQEGFYMLCFFQMKMLVLLSLPVCFFCHIRNTSVAISAFKSLHRWTFGSHIFFPYNEFGKLVTNIPLVLLITSTLQKHYLCPILLTSYSFDLSGFGSLGTVFWEGSHDRVAAVSSPSFFFFLMDENINSYQYVMDFIIVWLSLFDFPGKNKSFPLTLFRRRQGWKVCLSCHQLSLRFINNMNIY